MVLLTSAIVSFFSFSFISSLILIISFFLLTLGFVAVVVLLLLYPAAVDVVKVKVAQLCPALCDPMDYTVHGILQAIILEWVAVPLSRGSSQSRNQTGVPCIAEFYPFFS